MTKADVISELLALKISKARIERDNGMPHGNLNKYCKDPARLPNKWADKLTTYVRLKKDVSESDWGKLVQENEQLKIKIQNLHKEIGQLRGELKRVQLSAAAEVAMYRLAADSWNKLMGQHEKVRIKKHG